MLHNEQMICLLQKSQHSINLDRNANNLSKKQKTVLVDQLICRSIINDLLSLSAIYKGSS